MSAMILDRAVVMIGAVLVPLACVFVTMIARFGAGVRRGSGGRLMMDSAVASFSECRLECEHGHGEKQQDAD